jgi:hypothetical protein
MPVIPDIEYNFSRDERLKKKRPFLLKVIIFSLAWMAVMGWLRVYQSLYQWETLQRFGVQPGPWYSLITGVIIGLIGMVASVLAWLQRTWSRKVVQLSILILVVGWWLDYLLLSQNNTSFYNVPFRIVATIVYVGFIFGYFFLSQRKARRVKNEKHQ